MKKILLFLIILTSIDSHAQIQQEHLYGFSYIKRANLENRGEKYLLNFPSQYNAEIGIYDSDHNLEKNFPLPDTSIGRVQIIEFPSQKTFNSDDLLELPYIVNYNGSINNKVFVANENGTILFEQDSTNWFYISSIEGLPDKFVTTQSLNSSYTINYHDPKTFQITHSFTDQRISRYIRNGEEIFYIVSDNYYSLDLIQSDGSPIKSVSFPVSPLHQNQVNLIKIFNDELVSNSKLEFLFKFPINNNLLKYQLIDEDENVLFDEDFQSLLVDRQPNLEAKLIGIRDNKTYIYNKSFALEHTFPFEANRIYLDGYGEKYYRIPNQSNNIEIYNSDFTLWKTISFQANNFNLKTIQSISSKKVNSNVDLEIFVSAQNSSTSDINTYLMDDTGNLIHTFTQYTSCKLSEIEGLPNKVIAKGYNSNSSINGIFSIQNAPVSIPEEPNGVDLKSPTAYPNPFETNITINLLNSASTPIVEVYTLLGAMVHPKQIRNNQSIELNFDNCANGVYLIKLKEESSLSTLKVVKEN